MKCKRLLLMLLVALLAPWAAMAQQALPYSYGFEDNDLSADGWTLSGSTSTSTGIKTDAKRSGTYGFRFHYSERNAYLMSPILTGATTGLDVGFYYKNYNSSYTEKFQVGYTTDETITNPASFTYGNEISGGNAWAKYESTLPAGTKRVAIKYVYTDAYYLYLDDFTFVAAATCPKPTGLTCTAYTATTATLSWTAGGSETAWMLQYGTDNTFATGTYSEVPVSTNPTQLTGLTAETTYYARVKADCGDGDQSEWSNVCEFKPSAALIIGNGTSTGSSTPLVGNYKSSYDQMIYTASQLQAVGINAAGSITKIGFNSSAANTYARNVKIYMGHTDKTSFSGNTDFIAYNDLQLVYDYTAHSQWSIIAGWNDFELDTPFDYDGSSNLVIAVHCGLIDNFSSSYFYYTATSSNQVVYAFSDSYDPVPSTFDPSSYSGSKSTTTQLPNLKLFIEITSTPKPTNLAVNDITAYGATVAWQAPTTATPTGYEYQYSADGGTTWTTLTSTTGTSVNLTSLTPNTEYTFQVRANYTEGDSDFAQTTFTTLPTCLVPEGLAVNDMVATWTVGAASQWNLQYKKSSDATWTSVPGLTTATYDFNDLTLDANTDYDVQVQADCGPGDLSDWTTTVTFRTPCGAEAIPYTYGFEDAAGFDCWTIVSGNITRISGTAHGGSYRLDFRGTTSNMIALPAMNANLNTLSIEFWTRSESTNTNCGKFVVGYMTDLDDASTFVPVSTPIVAGTGTDTYTKQFVDFNVEGVPANAYIAFRQYDCSTNYYWYVDDVTVKVPVYITAHQIVNTVNDATTEMTWSQFVQHWNNGDHFTSNTFTLMDDITITDMVGTAENPFSGTFDGDNHTITADLTATDNNFTAPFRIIRNATIQNLKVDGTINDGGFKFCAGFAGDCYGNNIFTNCESAVTIDATIEGDGTHGGFIARNYGGSSNSNVCTTVFNGCAFTGQLLGTSTTQSAGFCGWSEYQSPNYAKTIFNNCLFAPQAVTMSITSSATFARRRNATYVNFNNCYFMQDFNDGTNNTAQGKQAYTITGVDPVTVLFSGEHILYNMSGIDAYTEGMLHGYIKLAGEGDDVTLSLDGAPGYEATHGTLVANGETFTLTMEAYDTEIIAVDCPVPYNVAVSNVEARSAQVTWTGASDSYTVEYREVITPAVDLNVTYDFEDGQQGWTTIDADGHGNAWSRQTSGGFGSNGCMKATYNSNYAHQDYLVSPQITLGGSLSFYIKKGGSYTDTFRVYLSTTGNINASDFTIELTDGDVDPTNNYTQYTYDLSDYSGMGYVAIVYTAAADQLNLYVDDITITAYAEGEYGEWQPISNATSPQTINNLTPETTYEVRVKGNCAGVETDYSDVVEFTTPASCFAPEGLAIVEGSLHAHGVQVSWEGETNEWFQYYMIVGNHEEPDENMWGNKDYHTTIDYDGQMDPNSTCTFFLRKYCGVNDYSDFVRLVINVPAGNLPPTALEANATGANTATAIWTGVSTNTYHESYDLYFSTESTMPEELVADNLIEGITDASYNLTGLNASTTYYVWVRDNCGSDSYSEWTGPVSFNTDCGAIALPYTYGFEDAGQLACWTMTNCISSTGISSSANHTGSYGFAFHWLEESQQCLISPEFESTTAQVAVSFYYKNPATGYDETFLVGYSTTTNDVAAFTWGDEITIAAGENDWTPYNDVFPAGTKYVALKHTSDDAYYLYVDDFSFQPVFTKTIAAVGEEGWANGKGGYYFIASPVDEFVTPAAANGFITDNYDLYYFSQTGDSEGNEWINFKTLVGFDIVNGKGYLYASKEGTTLTFTGTPGTNGNVPLDNYDANARFKGWNLIGNPFAEDAYITKPFYTLENSDTYTSNEAGTAIHAMQGVLITAEAEEKTVIFSTEAPATSNAKLNMNLRRNNKQLDNAILVFGGEQKLGKMTFRANSSKIFMPVEGKDYAITSVEGQVGEMPVSFKAEENGTYTLSFTSEEVSFSYLHLIDNMTGADVDLLANPTYSFDALTTDYESRFRLVFATGSSVDGDTFGFVNGMGNLTIFGLEGTATLQVMDVTGRVLSSEQFSGSYEKRLNVAPGVYMLRLINGNDVKVQKIVVR